MPRSRMIRMAVRDDGPFHLLPWIDMEIAGRTVEPILGKCQQIRHTDYGSFEFGATAFLGYLPLKTSICS